MTSLSVPKPPMPRGVAGLRRVAWVSLLAGVVLAAVPPSCLVAQSTTFPVPDARGPFIIDVDPPAYAVVALEANDLRSGRPTSLTLTVRSDDEGQPLEVLLFEDYRGGGTGRRVTFAFAQPDTFDTPRDVHIAYTPSETLSVGCHSVTALVTHNYDTEREQVTSARALATWWLSVGDGQGGAVPMNCYGTVPAAPGAGDGG